VSHIRFIHHGFRVWFISFCRYEEATRRGAPPQAYVKHSQPFSLIDSTSNHSYGNLASALSEVGRDRYKPLKL
jgi:hypothetical protein